MTLFRRRLLSPFCILTSLLVLSALVGASAQTGDIHFDTLQQRLVRDGFSQARINEIYSNPQVFFETRAISRFLVHRESTLNYDQFVSDYAIKRARGYLKKHGTALERTEQKYGVDKEVITAIILVETQLGNSLGKTSVLNILSTMGALDAPEVREMFWKKVSKTTQTSRSRFESWSERKSKWAYGELKAFLKYTAKEKIDPATVYGSYAGAMGIAQFIPSSVLAYGKDGNGNGRIDLFEHDDAIASIANYLKRFGWHTAIDKKKAEKVIFRYNRSSYYVDTILKISEILKTG